MNAFMPQESSSAMLCAQYGYVNYSKKLRIWVKLNLFGPEMCQIEFCSQLRYGIADHPTGGEK